MTLNMHAVHNGRCKAGDAIPRQTLRVPGGWGSQNSRHSMRKGGKVVIPTYRSPLCPGKCFCDSFVLEAESNHSAAGRIRSVKSSIEPATLRFVAQCLNELRHRMGHTGTLYCIKWPLITRKTVVLLVCDLYYFISGRAWPCDFLKDSYKSTNKKSV
jgi:hypothetical protein